MVDGFIVQYVLYISNEDMVYFYLGDPTARRKLIGIVSAVCAHTAHLHWPVGYYTDRSPPRLNYLSPNLRTTNLAW
jgi:hypothetical protein